MHESVTVILQFKVFGNGLHGLHNNQGEKGTQTHNHHKRRFPSPDIGQIQTDRNSQNLTCSKSHLNKSHHPTPLLKGENISNNGHTDGADDATKQSRNNAGGNYGFVRIGQTAKQRASNKANIEE